MSGPRGVQDRPSCIGGDGVKGPSRHVLFTKCDERATRTVFPWQGTQPPVGTEGMAMQMVACKAGTGMCGVQWSY